MTRTRNLFRLTPLAALCLAGAAHATNGYFPHGYGLKAKGMGGAAVAMTEDSLGGANNPATMAFVGSRLDLGVDRFSPVRDATRTDAGFATLNGSVESGKTGFFVPELGYSRPIGQNLAVGVTVYGNGGMNTTYPQGNFNCGGGPANMLCGSGELGVDLTQLVVAPTLAYKLAPQHALGVSLLLGYQRFKASGLQAFDNPGGGFPDFTSAPGRVTNNGYDSATGVGLRLGYLGRFADVVSLGVAYAPKMNMGRFEKYEGLFADRGDFDIPAHYALGVAVTPGAGVTIALDLQRIEYSGVGAVGNASSVPQALGSAGGPGFGWQDITVVKLGLQWRANPAWTVRAGYNHGDNPVQSADVTFNILAPGVMTKHYTAGFTWAVDAANEFTGALMVAPRQSVAGPSLFNAVLGPGAGGNETIRMKQSSFGIAWSTRF